MRGEQVTRGEQVHEREQVMRGEQVHEREQVMREGAGT